MLMRCVDLFGITSNRHSAQRKAIGRGASASASVSEDLSSQFKEFSLNSQSANSSVKIIHAGGRVERYPTSLPASMIMEKYPGMCVARPDVFRRPNDCILSTDEMLLPGHKYFLLPCSTARKLKRKHQESAESKEAAKDEEKPPEKKVEVEAVTDEGNETGENAPCIAKDFFISNDPWSRCSLRQKAVKRKPFVPLTSRRRILQQLAWEPSLSTIQELSP